MEFLLRFLIYKNMSSYIRRESAGFVHGVLRDDGHALGVGRDCGSGRLELDVGLRLLGSLLKKIRLSVIVCTRPRCGYQRPL